MLDKLASQAKERFGQVQNLVVDTVGAAAGAVHDKVIDAKDAVSEKIGEINEAGINAGADKTVRALELVLERLRRSPIPAPSVHLSATVKLGLIEIGIAFDAPLDKTSAPAHPPAQVQASGADPAG